MGEKQPDAVVTPTGISDADLTRLAEMLAPAIQRASIPGGQQVQQSAEPTIYRNGPANVSTPEDISAQTVDLVRNAQANLTRSGITNSTGYTGYDLKTPAAALIPFMTPLLNMTPRENGVGVPVHNWKAVVDLFGGSGAQGVIGSVADGGTPMYLARSVVPMSNTFQTIAAMDSLTMQAEWRGRQLQGDMRAMLTAQLIIALKMVEENWLINMSDKLWTPPPLLLGAANSGGTITSASGANMYFIVTAVNANGETLGTQIQSIAVPGTTSSITLTIFTVPNATKYNVYAGQAGSAPANSAMWLQGAAAQFGSASALNQPANPSVGSFTAVMTAPPATSGTAYSTVAAAGNTAQVAKDGSGNSLTYQGAQALIYNNAAANAGNGTGGLKSQIIQPAATTGYLALSDIQNLLLYMFQNARANPRYLFVSPQDSITISNLVASNGETRVVVDGSKPLNGQASLTAGFRVGQFLNQVTQSLVEIVPLPYLAQGTIIAGSFSFPYPVAGYSQSPFRVITNREYYGVEYPPTLTNPSSWGYGDFVDETLVNEYLGGWGVINGIVYH